MAATRKPTVRKTGAKKPASGIAKTKTKAKRVARKAQAALGEAAHEAGLALRSAVRKLKRGAVKLEAKVQEAKAPARRKARRVEREIASAMQSAGESLTAAGKKAKTQLRAAKRALVGTPPAKKPAAGKRTAKRSMAR
jgi:molecular chaperone GrpE (heat shock protein)